MVSEISDRGILRFVDLCFESTFYLPILVEELQVLSRMEMYTICRDQQGKFSAILHYVNMDIMLWIAHKATENCVNAIILHNEYSCRGLFDSDFNGQYSVILYESLPANCCIFRQKCCKLNSRSFCFLQI